MKCIFFRYTKSTHAIVLHNFWFICLVLPLYGKYKIVILMYKILPVDNPNIMIVF